MPALRLMVEVAGKRQRVSLAHALVLLAYGRGLVRCGAPFGGPDVVALVRRQAAAVVSASVFECDWWRSERARSVIVKASRELVARGWLSVDPFSPVRCRGVSEVGYKIFDQLKPLVPAPMAGSEFYALTHGIYEKVKKRRAVWA